MDDLRLSDLRESWKRHLTAANKAKGTRTAYLRALDLLVADQGDPELSTISQGTIESFMAGELERFAPASVSIDYRALQQFFKWATAQGEIERNPMLGMKPPIVPVEAPPVMREEDTRLLLDACSGNSFEDRRDLAIVRLFLSAGIRLTELTRIETERMSVADRRVTVLGKGRRERVVRFGLRAANAIERYQRIRRRHRQAGSPFLWLGERGPLTPNGVYQIIRRRARKAGVAVHPHLFRHTFAHNWMAAGGQESDLQTLAGWKSAQMLRRYGASAANERALSAYDRVAVEEV